ncbi:MAG TPA: ABC transporter ATP-binding protein [Bryobacteraceae bacterium]|nr:ABC transporter ATP-binding protein [Bryobacteraceae bacterium]
MRRCPRDLGLRSGEILLHVKLEKVEEEVLGKAYDSRLMRRLVGYMRPYRKMVAISLLFLLVQSGLQVLGPLLTKIAVDQYLDPTGAPVPAYLRPLLPPDPWSGLTRIGILYLLLLAGAFVTKFIQMYLMQYTGQLAMFDLRKQLMEHLQRMDMAFYDRNPVGRLVTRVTTDVDVLNDLFASGLVTILGDLLMLSFIVAIMFRLSPLLTGIMMGAMPFVILVTVLFRRSVMQSYRRIRVAIAKINSYLQEHVTGIVVLQLFNRERRSREEFDRVNHEHMAAFKDAIISYGWFYPVVEFISMLALAGILVYGGFRVQSHRLTLGVVVAFLQYGLRFFRPIQDLSEKYNILQAAMASSERIFRLLDTEAKVLPPDAPQQVPASIARIEFDHVWFAYKDNDWVLQDVSFTIEPGETIAVVGHTGAGKTTLISLLLRFYDIQKGAIRVGGVDVRDFDPLELRRQFGVVLQDPYLFTGTLEENIRLGTEAIRPEEVEAAAEQVNLLDFIRGLPEGFEHPVRERGSGLSTGQKQLISFARALAHNPRYLILDEATSSVDTETEFRVRAALERMVEGHTSIVIAHRLSTIQRADRILVMHKGKLRESGTHQELLAQRGIYWKLYQLQYKDQELRVSPGPRREETVISPPAR